MPQAFAHPRLGVFTDPFDDGVELWGEVTWQGLPCKLALIVDETGEVQDLAATACAILDREAGLHIAIQHAAAALHPVWQTSWRAENQPDLPVADWLALLAMREISVYPEQQFEVCLEDGGLFNGHAILIPGALPEGLGKADTAG